MARHEVPALYVRVQCSSKLISVQDYSWVKYKTYRSYDNPRIIRLISEAALGEGAQREETIEAIDHLTFVSQITGESWITNLI